MPVLFACFGNLSAIKKSGYNIETTLVNITGDPDYKLFKESLTHIKRRTYYDGTTRNAVLCFRVEEPLKQESFKHAVLFRVKKIDSLLSCMAYDSNGFKASGSCSK